MEIDNPVLNAFNDQTLRPATDLISGILDLLDKIPNAAAGKGIPEILGTTTEKLLQAAEWTDADYAAVTQMTIKGSDSDGRNLLTNWDDIGVLRAIITLQLMVAAHPNLRRLIARVARNPRIFPQVQAQ